MMNLKIFTYEDFCKYLEKNGADLSRFTNRCEIMPFKPNFIAIWGRSRISELDQKILEWYQKEKFMGQVNKPWPCQIEFEKEEDAVYFKLLWT